MTFRFTHEYTFLMGEGGQSPEQPPKKEPQRQGPFNPDTGDPWETDDSPTNPTLPAVPSRDPLVPYPPIPQPQKGDPMQN